MTYRRAPLKRPSTNEANKVLSHLSKPHYRNSPLHPCSPSSLLIAVCTHPYPALPNLNLLRERAHTGVMAKVSQRSQESQRSLVQRLDAASAEMSMSPAQLEQLDSLDLVHVFARCCDNHEKLSTTLVDIVKILRERRYYIDTPHEASTVRDLIKSACGATRKKADTIEKYVSSLV